MTQVSAGCGRLLPVVAMCLLTACAGKSPQEVEAERAKANAEWNAQVESAERARQREEKRLVDEQLAAHARQAQIDDERTIKPAEVESNADQERLLQFVRAKTADPQSASFSNVHWNATRSALCGEVQGMRFIASGDQASVDAAGENEHAEFAATAGTIDCAP